MGEFLEYLQEEREDLLELTAQHIVIVAAAVAFATVIGVAIGVLTYRTERPRDLALAITSTFLTIPSMALFGLFVTWFGLRPLNLEFFVGQWMLDLNLNVLLALVIYGLLPIVRNTIVGLREVDPAIVEAAQGMGMGRTQQLLRIEIPLAWPVILTGMRVSTLILLGIAAIGAYINGPGLGAEIFGGLSRLGTDVAIPMILSGMLGVLVLAILFDLLYLLITRLTTSRGLR
ncbi:MAG: ABC transporter permease subunit [Propionibacteriales bacterium]|nr:ABC transporter permease subunit [Propionibacteriales bacterium]